VTEHFFPVVQYDLKESTGCEVRGSGFDHSAGKRGCNYLQKNVLISRVKVGQGPGGGGGQFTREQ
jgi:hypothetical protein